MSEIRAQFAIVGGGIVGTFLADHLTRRGATVALIERGSTAFSTRGAAAPAVECAKRQHIGAYKARNHVLGGNGFFWGGGLVRPPSTRLCDLLGASADSGDFDTDLIEHFVAVEAELAPNYQAVRVRCSPEDCGIGPLYLSETMVLAGRARNISLRALSKLRANKRCQIIAEAELIHFSRSGMKIASVEIVTGGQRVVVRADTIVISAGTINSNLILLRHANELGVTADIGRGLHEHLSVPMYAVTGFVSPKLRKLVAPSIRNGAVVGRRFEIPKSPAFGHGGFIHFQFPFDDVSPYREIKDVMALRQQRAGFQANRPSGANGAVSSAITCDDWL